MSTRSHQSDGMTKAATPLSPTLHDTVEPASPELIAGPGAGPRRVAALQRSIGNRATLQLLAAERAASRAPELLTVTPARPQSVMRALMSLREWRTTTAVDDAGQRVRGPRSSKLRRIDNRLDRFNQQRGYPQHEFGLTALNALSAAIQDFLNERAGRSSRVGHVRTLQTAANGELPEINEMRQIRDNLLNNFGIRLDNGAGIDSIYRFYRSQGAAARVLRQLRENAWQVNDLRQIERALTLYRPLLGANRPGALGAQTITTFSRVRADIDLGLTAIEGTHGTTESTFAETFTQRPGGRQLSNISVFNHAGSVMDFVADPANPTPAELERGYRGTIIHELSHGLIEMLPNPPLPAPAPAPAAAGGAAPAPAAPAAETFPDGRPVTNMLQHFANQMAYWTDTRTPSNRAGAEAPITNYGQTSAAEDMAEAIMYFFEAPAQLQRQCPDRYRFVTSKLTAYLDPASVQTATQAAIQANPDLNPPPPPAAGAAAAGPAAAGAAAAPGGGGAITPAALAAGAAALRPAAGVAAAGPAAAEGPAAGGPPAAGGAPGAAPGAAGPAPVPPPAAGGAAAPGAAGPVPGAAGGEPGAAGPEAAGGITDAEIDQLIAELDAIFGALEANPAGAAESEAAPEPEAP